MIKAILTKPLDGDPEGAVREFDKADFEALRGMGAVRLADELRTDGPTVAEYIAAGYGAETYPPQGYASRSTPEEIAAAIAAQPAPPPGPNDLQSGQKAAPTPLNKSAPPLDNKAQKV